LGGERSLSLGRERECEAGGRKRVRVDPRSLHVGSDEVRTPFRGLTGRSTNGVTVRFEPRTPVRAEELDLAE
jgi:hypothetical protein